MQVHQQVRQASAVDVDEELLKVKQRALALIIEEAGELGISLHNFAKKLSLPPAKATRLLVILESENLAESAFGHIRLGVRGEEQPKP